VLQLYVLTWAVALGFVLFLESLVDLDDFVDATSIILGSEC
jgi:hypothetical protein